MGVFCCISCNPCPALGGGDGAWLVDPSHALSPLWDVKEHEGALVVWRNSDSLDLQKQLPACFARSRLFLWESSVSIDVLSVGWSCSVPKKDKGSGFSLGPWLEKDEAKFSR